MRFFLPVSIVSGSLLVGLLAAAPTQAEPIEQPVEVVSVGARSTKPLAGLTIAIDPGHQLGNSNPAFRNQLARTKFNGTITKSCNTTGTATNSGFPEATFVFKVSRTLKNRLERQGATVKMTRTTNSYDRYGPCVWKRGKFGAKVDADLLLSVHADGGPASGRGFFVIVPGVVAGWTDDIAAKSQRYGKRLVAGMAAAGATPSTYINGQTLIWNDVTTLNFSDVPAVLVEVGNMRNAAEARDMVTRKGQRAYATWLIAGVKAIFRR